jgi:hypothetical protein
MSRNSKAEKNVVVVNAAAKATNKSEAAVRRELNERRVLWKAV